MLKKAFQIVTTVALLTAGYAGYRRGFAVLVARSGGAARVERVELSPLAKSRTEKEADQLAELAFGKDHWTVRPGTKFRYYNSEQGYWLISKEYKRLDDGKQLVLEPLALIWTSRDRRSLKTLEGGEATIDFDRSLDPSKSGSGTARVVLARIEAEANGDVRLRDDKGTPDRADDLTITDLKSLTFDGRNDRILSNSGLTLKDRDMTATAVGLQIDLRPKPKGGAPGEGSSGYAGASRAYLLRHVRIHVADVGRSGLVPGTGQGLAIGPRPDDGPKPGVVQSEGPMEVLLPAPRPRVHRGPPVASEPTYVHFQRNVKLLQGDPKQPDQIDADDLKLVLVPREDLPAQPETKAPPRKSDAVTPSGESKGALTGLVLVRADATAHQGQRVWLQSPTQGLRGEGNQLIYERHFPAKPDVVYFRGDRYTDVEKFNYVASGPDAGKVESVDKIRTIDVTIHQTPGVPASIVARGPGTLKTLAAKGGEVERSASWREQLVMRTYIHADGRPRRHVTLTGPSMVSSPTQGTINARQSIVAQLKPSPRPEAAAPSSGAGDVFRIEWMEAKGDVHMIATGAPPAPGQDPTAPASRRTIDARETLSVVFDEPAAPAPRPVQAGPVVAHAPAAAPPGPAAPPPPKPAEPNLDVKAGVVWARVLMRPGTGNKGDVQEVQLRRDVAIHQGPSAGQPRGTDINAEAVNMNALGQGRWLVEARGTVEKPAVVSTPEYTAEGPSLWLDQVRDLARVVGPGRFVQQAVAKDPKNPNSRPIDGPLEITWRKRMVFEGRPTDAQGQVGPARADFHEHVRARTPDSSVACERMIATMDRPVALSRPARDPADTTPREPNPQIVTVRCLGSVDISNRKLDPTGKLIEEKQRILGDDVLYDKPTGEFTVPGPGVVYHYGRGKPGEVALGNTRSTSRLKPPAGGKLAPLELTRIRFADGMKGRFNASQFDAPSQAPPPPGPREADFSGSVEVLRAKVADESADLDADDPPADFLLLTSRALHMASEPAPPGSKEPALTWLDARGDVQTTTSEQAIRGDRMKYNSKNDLIYIYGHDNEVIIGQQDNPGQQGSYARGSVVVFNRLTKEARLVDPKTFALVDPKGIVRAAPRSRDPDRPEQKPKRALSRPPSRSDKDRRGFTGR